MDIVVFGYGNNFKEKEESICELYEVVGIVDSDTSKQGQVVRVGERSLLIEPPDLKTQSCRNKSILITPNDFVPIVYSLLEYGIDDNDILFLHNIKGKGYDKLFCNDKAYLGVKEGNLIYYFNDNEYHIDSIDEFENIKQIILDEHLQITNALSFYDYKNISLSYPANCANTKWYENCIYSHEEVLKRFADISSDSTISAEIEHGNMMIDYMYAAQLDCELPSIIVMSPWRKKLLEKCTNKKIYDIGPYIAYAKAEWNDEQIKKQKEVKGRTLLVFPSHSGDDWTYDYCIQDFVEEIEKVGSTFDTIMICLYWKDIERGADRIYIEKGWDVVSAGFTFQSKFMSRLKTIIECSDMIMTNLIGTYVAYGIQLGIPVYIFRQELSAELGNGFKDVDRKYFHSESQMRAMDCIYEAFDHPTDTISNKQIEVAREFFGIGSVKTSQELRKIFDECDAIYDVSYKMESND